ncbi:MAG: site-specific DNA-methyltransferase [Bacteroidales bacterium]|nr:site-specific DNA-methyltransferase [Bacteroidales bacterium]
MCFISEYRNTESRFPLFVQGDSLGVLRRISANSVDCCVTSPPYWQKRQYENGGIGLETSPQAYVDSLYAIIKEVKRVLKSSGSFWLNIGDSYHDKSLQGIPWRVALKMIDDGWILRNNVIWNKHKGGLSPNPDRFGSVFEYFFFFVKSDKYYFDADSIRSKPRQAIVKNGAVISATGVSGIRYKRQIELSTSLSDEEKKQAMDQLEGVLARIKRGEISDFRMVIRNEQRTTHSDSTKLSGRAKELKDKGFYFLFYNPKGTMPNDVWDIIPEDTQHRKLHFAPYPEELCVIPIKSTCPKNGIVLDPFSGTGTTMKVAYELGRKSVGIDLSNEYIKLAKQRICQESGNFLPFQ